MLSSLLRRQSPSSNSSLHALLETLPPVNFAITSRLPSTDFNNLRLTCRSIAHALSHQALARRFLQFLLPPQSKFLSQRSLHISHPKLLLLNILLRNIPPLSFSSVPLNHQSLLSAAYQSFNSKPFPAHPDYNFILPALHSLHPLFTASLTPFSNSSSSIPETIQIQLKNVSTKFPSFPLFHQSNLLSYIEITSILQSLPNAFLRYATIPLLYLLIHYSFFAYLAYSLIPSYFNLFPLFLFNFLYLYSLLLLPSYFILFHLFKYCTNPIINSISSHLEASIPNFNSYLVSHKLGSFFDATFALPLLPVLLSVTVFSTFATFFHPSILFIISPIILLLRLLLVY